MKTLSQNYTLLYSILYDIIFSRRSSTSDPRGVFFSLLPVLPGGGGEVIFDDLG